MSKSTKRNAKFSLIGIIAIVVIGLLFIEPDDVLSSDNVSFTINIPDDSLSFTGQTSTNSNPSITCDLKQVTYGIDSTGGTVSVTNSKLLSGNPLLAVTTTDGVKMAGYVVEPKIFCKNNFNDDNVSNPDRFTFIIDSSSLSVQVNSNDKSGTKLTTHIASFTSKSASIPIGGGEASLGSVGIYSTQIEDNLQDGSYGTTNQFDIRGNLKVYWKGYSGVKYTIPINFGELTSYHNARIEKGSTSTTTYTGNDKDGDGILDSYDKCPTDAENYNGYNDSDGCPDTSPTQVPTTTTTTTTSSMIYTECIAGQRTWVMDSTFKTKSYCMAGGIASNTSGQCGIYDDTTKQCVVYSKYVNTVSGCVTMSDGKSLCPSDPIFTSGECKGVDMDLCLYKQEQKLGTTSTTSSGITNGISGTMKWQGDVKYSDASTDSFLADKDPSPFSFTLNLNQLVGGVNAGEKKQISQLTLHPILKFNNAEVQKKISTASSDLYYMVTLKINDGYIIIVPKTPLPDFAPTSGATKLDGISLGNIIVKMSDVENKIPATTVGLNESANVELKVILIGSMGVNYNDGFTVKPLKIQFNEATLSTGEFKGESSFIWTNLVVARGTSTNVGGITDPAPDKCDPDQTGYVLNGVLICTEKGITVTDENNDGVIDESSGGTCAGLTPAQCLAQGKTSGGGANTNTSNGGMCPLDSGAGDSNNDGKICQICTDSSGGIGGFPCDEGYRKNYCNDTTVCNSEPKAGDDVGGAKVADPNTNDGTITCGLNTLSLADDACVIQTGDSPDVSRNDNICINGNCTKVYPNDTDTLLYVIAGIVMIGGLGYYIHKRKS